MRLNARAAVRLGPQKCSEDTPGPDSAKAQVEQGFALGPKSKLSGDGAACSGPDVAELRCWAGAANSLLSIERWNLALLSECHRTLASVIATQFLLLQ